MDWSRHHKSKEERRRLQLAVLMAGTVATVLFSWYAIPDDAQAIPAFARKYDVNCTVCHSAPPVLNQFGQRFLENGYQLPATEDGGVVGKIRVGEATLDDVKNYLGFRLVGNAIGNWSFKRENPSGLDAGVVENKTEFTFPETLNLFAGGTVAKNVGFFVEVEHQIRERETGVERGFVTINNLVRYDLAHLRIGRLDPSAYSSYATVRQQLAEVGASSVSSCSAFTPCGFNRAGLVPSAFATKFYGLYDSAGTYLSPFAASLFHANSETGIDVHGRPFGDWLLYQVGILNGAGEGFGDSNKGKDIYGMVRLDYARSQYFSANVSGFVYYGNSNAKVQSQDNVNWNRYGVSARATYQMIDLYGAFAIDKISRMPGTVAGTFDRTATGLTLGVDAYITDQALVSIRYDNMDAGGMLDERKSATFIGVQGKYYVRTNLSIFVRNDVNIRRSEEGDSAARNLRNAFFCGIDMVF